MRERALAVFLGSRPLTRGGYSRSNVKKAVEPREAACVSGAAHGGGTTRQIRPHPPVEDEGFFMA